MSQLPFEWRQGEHLTLSGMTGSGKTTLAAKILARRAHVVSLISKDDDSAIPGKRIKLAKQFPKLNLQTTPHAVLYPEYRNQFPAFYNVLEHVWKEGNWCVYLDELYYMTSQLPKPITLQINRLLTQGRSKGITVVSGMQRPVGTTRFQIGESTHVVSFMVDDRDAMILRDVAGRAYADTVMKLDRYQFAWYYRPTRQIWSGRLQDLGYTL